MAALSNDPPFYRKRDAMNKEVTTLVRELRKQGADIRNRRGGSIEVRGPNGIYLLHRSPSAGGTMAMTRKHLRRIGFNL